MIQNEQAISQQRTVLPIDRVPLQRAWPCYECLISKWKRRNRKGIVSFQFRFRRQRSTLRRTLPPRAWTKSQIGSGKRRWIARAARGCCRMFTKWIGTSRRAAFHRILIWSRSWSATSRGSQPNPSRANTYPAAVSPSSQAGARS